MNNLKELEKKYEELGNEIERLKKEQSVGFENDPIFLLSVEEYVKYEQYIPHNACYWWLRSPGNCLNNAAEVRCTGTITYDGDIVVDCSDAIRPALRISKLKSPNLKFVKDDYLSYCGVVWIKLDDDLYIAEIPIAFHRFDEKSNDYENSEIRKFLLDWHKERKNW